MKNITKTFKAKKQMDCSFNPYLIIINKRQKVKMFNIKVNVNKLILFNKYNLKKSIGI